MKEERDRAFAAIHECDPAKRCRHEAPRGPECRRIQRYGLFQHPTHRPARGERRHAGDRRALPEKIPSANPGGCQSTLLPYLRDVHAGLAAVISAATLTSRLV